MTSPSDLFRLAHDAEQWFATTEEAIEELRSQSLRSLGRSPTDPVEIPEEFWELEPEANDQG